MGERDRPADRAPEVRMTVDVDPDRVARAAQALRDGKLRIDPGTGPGVYVVRSFSRARSYRVRLNGELRCDCPDVIYNGTRACKHALAVILAAGLQGRL